MSPILGYLITIVICLLGGAGGMWFWNKKRRMRFQDEAEEGVEESIENDADRENVKKLIAARIKKNEEIRKKLQEKLKKAEG